MSTDDIPNDLSNQVADAVTGTAEPSQAGDALPTVVQAIARVMAEVQAVGKNDLNKQQGFNFRGIDAVINAVGPAFRRHGVVPTVTVHDATYRDLTSKQGNAMRECVVDATYRFYGPAGDYVESTFKGEAMDSADKATAKATSVAYRTCLIQTLCIPTHETDPDEYSYERAGTAPVRTVPADVPDGYLGKVDAKNAVLESARAVPGSTEEPTPEEKARAVRAWESAGLNGREHVTPEEMSKAATLAKLYTEQEAHDDDPETETEDAEPEPVPDPADPGH